MAHERGRVLYELRGEVQGRRKRGDSTGGDPVVDPEWVAWTVEQVHRPPRGSVMVVTRKRSGEDGGYVVRWLAEDDVTLATTLEGAREIAIRRCDAEVKRAEARLAVALARRDALVRAEVPAGIPTHSPVLVEMPSRGEWG